MAKTQIRHGATIEAATRDEVEELLRQYTTRQRTRERVRAPVTTQLDANGAATIGVYDVPSGFELEVRRVQFDLGSVTETTFSASAVLLNAAGVSVQYLRSGLRIEWGAPSSPNGITVPGIQTWGSEQGPYLRNGEAFQVKVNFGAALGGVTLTVSMEGILTQGGSLK